jgi:hypothetical protein
MFKFHPHRVANFQIGGMPQILQGASFGNDPSALLSGAGGGAGAGGYDVAGGLGNVGMGFATGGPVGGAMAAVPELFKLYQGFKQKREAKKLAQQRPEFEIPAAATEALEMQRSQALSQRLPGQALAQENLGRSTQRGMEAIREGGGSSAEIIAGATNLAGQEQAGLNQQAVQAAQFQQQAQQNLVGGLQQYAGYQQQKQQYDVLDPFAQQMRAKAALEEGSMQNIYGGMKGTAAAGIESMPEKWFKGGSNKASTYTGDNMASMFGKMFPQQTTG